MNLFILLQKFRKTINQFCSNFYIWPIKNEIYRGKTYELIGFNRKNKLSQNPLIIYSQTPFEHCCFQIY